MQYIELTIGVPGSGKTTYADSVVLNSGGSVAKVERDEIRHMMFNFNTWDEYEFTAENEEAVTVNQQAMARAHIENGRSVIISDTNLNPKYREQWQSIAKLCGVEYREKVIHVSEQEALLRNETRGDKAVATKVLRLMYANYMKDSKEQIIEHFRQLWEKIPTASHLVFVDIDGTVAEMKDRKPFEWTKVGQDLYRPAVCELVKFMAANGKIIQFVSGRCGSCLNETVEWLQRGDLPEHNLAMRAVNDSRPDWVVKLEIFDLLIAHYMGKPAFILDDRNQVVDVMRAAGLDVFQVAPGDF